MKYSGKKASANSFLGIAIAVLPTLLGYFVARKLLDRATADLIGTIVGILTTAYGVEAVAYLNKKADLSLLERKAHEEARRRSTPVRAIILPPFVGLLLLLAMAQPARAQDLKFSSTSRIVARH